MRSYLISLVVAGAVLAGAAPYVDPVPEYATPQNPLLETPTLTGDGPTNKTSLEDIIDQSPLLSFHRDIVQIESVTGNEYNVGEFISQFLEARNFTVIKQTVTPANAAKQQKERFNIFAYPSNANNKTLSSLSSSPRIDILLTSHIDTVPPFIPYSLSLDAETGEDTHPHQPQPPSAEHRRRSIKISGRGTVDAKASVAAQIFAALDALRRSSSTSAPTIGLLFVVGEETGGDGMKHFSNSERNTAPPSFHTVIFGEPTVSSLVAGHKGMLGFGITARGKAAHSGYPWLGRSAVSTILPVLARIDRLGNIPVEDGGLPFSAKYGKTTVNVGVVRGGVAANVVPAAAEADVAVRLAAGTPDEARRIVRQAVRDALGGKDREECVEVDFESHSGAYGPQDLDADVEGFDVITVNYGTDVPNLVIHDSEDDRVKRYLYGPGSILVAHGDHESLTIGQLEDAVEGYRKLIDAALARNRR